MQTFATFFCNFRKDSFFPMHYGTDFTQSIESYGGARLRAGMSKQSSAEHMAICSHGARTLTHCIQLKFCTCSNFPRSLRSAVAGTVAPAATHMPEPLTNYARLKRSFFIERLQPHHQHLPSIPLADFSHGRSTSIINLRGKFKSHLSAS